MAISQTMSNPSDWLSSQSSYHNTDFFNFSQTETAPAAVSASISAVVSASRSNNLSPDHGRVTKPLRRRSRASRRTPTTLLNTDTANFRAMVQRFTGGPAAAFAEGSQAQIGGRLNFMEHITAAGGGGGGGSRPASGFHVQYPSQELQHHQQMMFMMGRGGGGDGPAAAPPGSASGNENRGYENYML